MSDTTPHFPAPHNLGSRDWTSSERDPEPQLGEVTTARREWDNGRNESQFVQPVLIGSRGCIQDGDKWPRSPSTIVLLGGWDSRCPVLHFPPIDQTDCHFQQWALDVILALYSGVLLNVTKAVASRYPTAVVHVEFATTDLTPACAVVRVNGFAIAISSGTQSVLQWVIQFLQGAIAPARNSFYTTLGIWQHGADVLSDIMLRAGVTNADSLIFAGHSLGAAISAIQAARARQAAPLRDIGLLTWGCPKPGDKRLIDLLFRVRQNNYVAPLDPVPLLPPSGWDAIALRFLLPGNILGACYDFVPLQNRMQLQSLGRPTLDFEEESILFYLVREVIRWLAFPSDATAPYYHAADNYRRLTVCPDHPPPPPPNFFYIAFGGGIGNGSSAAPPPAGNFVALEDGSYILLENGDKIVVE